VDFAQDGSRRCYYVSRPKLASVILDQLAEGEAAIRKSKVDVDYEKPLRGEACYVR
jgi:ArsR family transcriptional regulator